MHLKHLSTEVAASIPGHRWYSTWNLKPFCEPVLKKGTFRWGEVSKVLPLQESLILWRLWDPWFCVDTAVFAFTVEEYVSIFWSTSVLRWLLAVWLMILNVRLFKRAGTITSCEDWLGWDQDCSWGTAVNLTRFSLPLVLLMLVSAICVLVFAKYIAYSRAHTHRAVGSIQYTA